MRPNNLQTRLFPARLAGFTMALLLAAAVCCCLARPSLAARSPREALAALERQIAQEQARAKTRQESLRRLTQEERTLDAELAAREDGILRLEDSVVREEARLAELAESDISLQEKSEALLAEQAETEKAMTDVLRVLWELHSKKIGVGGRDLPDWHVTDREHAWSMELFASLDAYRKTLADQRRDLAAVKEKRAALQAETQRRIATLNSEKEALLQSRVEYASRLAELRREKSDTEKELAAILTLVQNLNLRLEAAIAEGDIEKSRGKLPWPVFGTVRGRFTPGASPPASGLIIALGADTPVRAVHWGKVVHNDVLRGIGRVVILMHGEDYYSLYAFLSESPLRIGQEVARGDVVGTSGFVTAIDGPGLYFELRRHQRAVNPEQWLRKL